MAIEGAEHGAPIENVLARVMHWCGLDERGILGEAIEEVCRSALLLIIIDREFTEGMVGDAMEGNNWGNFGQFVSNTELLNELLSAWAESNPLP